MNENDEEMAGSGRDQSGVSHRQKTVILGEGVGVPFKLRPIRRIKDARRGLSDVIAAAADDRLDIVKSKLLGYLLQVWCGIVKDSDLENRLLELEKKVSQK